MQMFIANTIKPLAIQCEREFTNKLFTPNEYYFGHRIEFDCFALTVTTLAAKTALFNSGIRNGYLNQDDCREYLGQPPLPNGLGRKYRVSADTVDISIVDKYQLGKVNETPNTKPNNDIDSKNAEDIETKKETSNGEPQGI